MLSLVTDMHYTGGHLSGRWGKPVLRTQKRDVAKVPRRVTSLRVFLTRVLRASSIKRKKGVAY